MGAKTVYFNLESQKSLAEVREAASKTFAALGGTMTPTSEGFQIKQGVNGVNFAFTADFNSTVQVIEITPYKYEVLSTINWTPNVLFWACLVIGLCVLGILWIVPLLYLFIDPTSAYQQASARIPSYLG